MFETAVVNEPSVFEPLKFYCIIGVCGIYTSVLPEVVNRQFTILQ